MSVCELFDDLRSHAGQMVSVRGMLYSGKEVYALGEHCKTSFVTTYNWAQGLLGMPELPPTGEFAWPTALDLAYSSFDDRGEKPVKFQTDVEACRLVDLFIKRGVAKLRPEDRPEIWITVVGQIRMKERYDVAKFNDGSLRGSGYGHLGAYPAQLVIKTVQEAVVRSVKK